MQLSLEVLMRNASKKHRTSVFPNAATAMERDDAAEYELLTEVEPPINLGAFRCLYESTSLLLRVG